MAKLIKRWLLGDACPICSLRTRVVTRHYFLTHDLP